MIPRRTALTAVALAAGSFALYIESLGFGFVRYDDGTILQSHPGLYDEHSLWGSLQESVRYLPREEPLLVRDLSWAIDSRVFGFANPFGYHLGNVVLNACNAALLFLFLSHATRRYAFAATVATLWVTLPLHVEPVAWIMGRKDMLAATFSLLMFLAQSVALRPETSARRKRLAELAVFLLYPLAVLSKFSAVAMVGALAVQRTLAEHLSGAISPASPIDVRVAARRTLGLAPHAVVGVALYVWYGRMLSAFGVTHRGPGPLDLRHLGLVAERLPLVFGLYLRNMVCASQHAIFYDWPSAGIALTVGQRVLSLSLALACAAVVLLFGRFRKDLLFYALVFAALMTTYLNLLYIGIWVADRYVYLTSFCLLALVVSLAEDVVRRPRAETTRKALLGILVAVALSYGAYGVFATMRHESAFFDAESLWTYESTREDPSMLAMEAYAKVFVVKAEQTHDEAERSAATSEARGAIARALDHYKAVPWLPIDRYVIDAHANYCTVLVLRGRVAAVAGASDEIQIGYYREALDFCGNWIAAMAIEQILFREADERDDPRIAQQALAYFEVVVQALVHDAARHDALRDRLLGGYRRRFPMLSPAVDAIMRRAHL